MDRAALGVFMLTGPCSFLATLSPPLALKLSVRTAIACRKSPLATLRTLRCEGPTVQPVRAAIRERVALRMGTSA